MCEDINNKMKASNKYTAIREYIRYINNLPILWDNSPTKKVFVQLVSFVFVQKISYVFVKDGYNVTV